MNSKDPSGDLRVLGRGICRPRVLGRGSLQAVSVRNYKGGFCRPRVLGMIFLQTMTGRTLIL